MKKERDSSGRAANRNSPDSSGSRKGEKRNSSPSEKPVDDKQRKFGDHRNLWVSGLASMTRATDLKHLFSKMGKVVSAKVVTNAKTPGARCYGFVTMATSEEAAKCIKGLNLTELHGRLISVEAAKQDSSGHLKKTESSQSSNRSTVKSSSKSEGTKRKLDCSPRLDEKKKRRDSETGAPLSGPENASEDNGEEGKKKEEGAKIERGRERERRGSRERRERHSRRGDNSSHRGSSRGRDHPPRARRSPGGVLSFAQIKEERERQRLREKERALREEERRRREERDRQREVERRQREEALRLEREREKIRMERERLERERAELLKMERDRLEREKEDLKRQQLKLEEARRGKRTLSTSRDSYDERSKRPAGDRRYESTHHSSPHFDSHSGSHYESSRGSAGSSFRSREERERRDDSHRNKSDSSSRMSSHHSRDRFETSSKDRYTDEVLLKDNRKTDLIPKKYLHRYPSGNDTWNSASNSLGKSFGGVVNSRDQWPISGHERKGPDLSPWARPPAQNERWVTGSSINVSNRGGTGLYPQVGGIGGGGGPSSMPLPMSNSQYQNSDRFDAYKPIGSLQRKY